ncbi:MAG: nucleotidyltransferase domain-containing protein [Nitrospirae bacterium]|uniref:nucleotidyltransferase domain-containing protein n=1 Tax=Candidatus Magnetobacterium casense TaxID=1455061 RepID=UPI00058B55BB|nr:nucleotidyltransferase domain-containing protein [Candidatus Magnetobacterium casensis]MBF0337939.1 nucleotidyltransferase domain-containing protein [Nitrospirota bacterium]
MTKDFEDKLKTVTEKLVVEFQPEKIILFGSYAWGKPTEDSDVDLLVIKELKETEDRRKVTSQINLSIFPRPFPIDLLVYEPQRIVKRLEMGDFFIEDIMTKGKILYARQ